jgi:RNA polymerase sigma-70 factor (ECF subfamily)
VDIDQNRNTDNFLSLLLPNQKQILAYIMTYVPNRSDADDILQNTLSILWKKFDRYEPGSDFLAYAVTIAKYEILSYYRACKKSGKLFLGDDVQKVIERDMPSTDRHFNTCAELLRECLKKLTGSETHLLIMRYQQDMSFSKIGQRLGISSPAALKKLAFIHSRLIRCIRLRLELESAT